MSFFSVNFFLPFCFVEHLLTYRSFACLFDFDFCFLIWYLFWYMDFFERARVHKGGWVKRWGGPGRNCGREKCDQNVII